MDGFVWMKERAPATPGDYTVFRRTGPRGGLATENGYYWDGKDWWTRSMYLSKAVAAWVDPELAKREQEPKHE